MRTQAGFDREPFGAWLIVQRDRGDAVDAIAAVARADHGFPASEGAEAARERLRQLGAGDAAMQALDHAELDWLAW